MIRSVLTGILFLLVAAPTSAQQAAGDTHQARIGADACTQGAEPSSIAEWTRRGDCLRDAKLNEAAVDAYRRGLAVNSAGSKDLYLGMASAYSELKQFEDELAAAQAAERIDPADPEVWYQLGIAHEVLRDYPEAMALFRKVIAARPNDNRAHRNIGYVLLQEGKPEEAIAPLETAIEIDPRDWKAHSNLAGAYSGAEKAIRNELLAFLQSGPHLLDPKDPAVQRNEEQQAKLKKTDYRAMTLEHAREAARLNPDDARTWYNLGTDLLNEPDAAAEAIDAFQKSVALAPDSYEALRNLAIIQQRARKKEDAYQTCLKIQKISTDDVWLLKTMGELEQGLGRDEDAEKSFRAALNLDGRDGDIHFELSLLLRRVGKTDESKRELELAKTLRPDMVPWYDHVYERP